MNSNFLSVVVFFLMQFWFTIIRERNDMFHNCFRSQTTKGIWIAHCVGIDPCTIAMDLEGTDGRERGEVTIFCYNLLIFSAK